MKPTHRPIRRLPTMVAAISLCVLAWSPEHVEPQANDLVAQGRQALDANRVDDALALFEKAVANDGKDPAALAWLGSAQVRKAPSVPLFNRPGWVKKGFNTLDEAVERFPDRFVVYMVRGITALRVPDMFRKTPVAVKDLSAVVAMKERNVAAIPDAAIPDAVMPSIYLHLGLAHKKNGQPAEAREAWEKGRALYPSSAEAQAMEKELGSL